MPTLKGIKLRSDNSGSIELGQEKVLRRYVLEFHVIADNASQGPITIRSTSGLPLVGISTYNFNGESDVYAVCKRKIPTRDSRQPLLWTVRCEFDNDPASQSQETENDNQAAPDRPPIVEWDSEYGEEVLYQDFSTPRKDIVNPVGHAFDPPVTKRVIYPVLTVTRFQATFTPATILAFVDHVNDAEFYGADAGQALMTQIAARQVVEDAVKLWQVTYRIRFAISEDGFDLQPLNQGTHHYDNTTDKNLVPFLDGQVPYVGNLTEDGTKAADGTRTYGGLDGTGFKPYPDADFDSLNL